MKHIYIIGGGPAGMMAALSSKLHHPESEVSLLERNHELGVKLKLTGGGRCNVTAAVNNEEIVENVVKNGKFLYSALTHFNSQDIISFFEKHGCKLKEEDHHRMFPTSNKSIDIVNTLKDALKEAGVHILYNVKVEEVDSELQLIKTENKEFHYDYLIVATGGKTYTQTGSDGSGYAIVEAFGHTITELLPAEVPLVSNDEVIQSKVLQGLSFEDVVVEVYQRGKIKKRIQHDLIFTHFGLSGPAALRASFDVLKALEKEKEVKLSIDFIPEVKNQAMSSEVLTSTLLEYKIPKRLQSYVRSICESDTEIFQMLKKFPISVYTTRGFSNAFVTNGGVKLKEIDPKTMKSKLCSNVSFCGELLDVNAYTGGYNITAAFVSGYVAGKFIS